jgi:hypothetical protein
MRRISAIRPDNRRDQLGRRTRTELRRPEARSVASRGPLQLSHGDACDNSQHDAGDRGCDHLLKSPRRSSANFGFGHANSLENMGHAPNERAPEADDPVESTPQVAESENGRKSQGSGAARQCLIQTRKHLIQGRSQRSASRRNVDPARSIIAASPGSRGWRFVPPLRPDDFVAKPWSYRELRGYQSRAGGSAAVRPRGSQ